MTDDDLDGRRGVDPLAVPLRDAEDGLNPAFLAALQAAIEAGDADRTRGLAGDLHEADLGDLIEALDPD